MDSKRISEWEEKWQKNFALLVEHQELFGDYQVKTLYDTWELTLKFKGLKGWIQKQRESAKKNKLKIDRMLSLDSIGFDFDPKLTDWLKQLDKLAEYKEKFGTCSISYHHLDKYKVLNNWTCSQRKRKESLTEFQRKKLDFLGFDWNSKDEKWYKNFDRLKEYKNKFGHSNVPDFKGNINIPLELRKLSRFVSFQRTQFAAGRLKEEYYRILADFQFEFDPLASKWEKYLADLLKFKEEFGDCNVPDKSKKNLPLATWVRKQRSCKTILPPEKTKILNEIGFIWDVREYEFLKNLEELKTWKEKYGHLKILRSENKKLYLWANNLRILKRKNSNKKLSQEKINLLNEIGFDWEPKEAIWEIGLKKLKTYKKINGHCIVENNKENRNLRRWISRQRKDRELLEPAKRKELDKIGFIWE